MSKMSKYPFNPIESGSLEPKESVLWDRSMVEEEKRGTHIIHQDDMGSIVADRYRTKRIATGNLTGCTAVAVVLEMNKRSEAYIQHFHHLSRDLGATMLRKFVDQRQGINFDRCRSVIMAPTSSAYGPLYSRVPYSELAQYYPEDVDELTLILTGLLTRNHDVTALAYPNILKVPHSLMVELPAGENPIISVSLAGVSGIVPEQTTIAA